MILGTSLTRAWLDIVPYTCSAQQYYESTLYVYLGTTGYDGCAQVFFFFTEVMVRSFSSLSYCALHVQVSRLNTIATMTSQVLNARRSNWITTN